MKEFADSNTLSTKFFGDGWDTVARNMQRYMAAVDDQIAECEPGDELDHMERIKT